MKNVLTLILGVLVGILGFWVIQRTRQPREVTVKVTSPTEPVGNAVTGGSPATSGKRIVIGFSSPGTDHGWLGAIKRNAEEAARSYPDVELVLTDAQNSSEKQMADLETLIQRKPDVIVILPHSGKALTPGAKKVHEAGIPLIVLDRKIESQDYYSYLVGDNYGIGQAAARFIGQKLNGKGNVAEVMGLAGISVTTERHKGFVDTLRDEYPDVKVVSSLAADFNADKALAVTESTLQAHPDLKAIYSHDDDMNVGVLQAVKQSGNSGKIFITGAGGSRLMMENIQNGDNPIQATFLYNPSMAGSAINLARLLALNHGMKDLWEPEIPREILLRASTVTKENVGNFLRLGY